MPVYPHFQEAKKAYDLPMEAKVGACLTCSWWQVETPRPETETQMVGLCIQPELKAAALIVSGSSACNKWHLHPAAGDEAHAYAERGEEK